MLKIRPVIISAVLAILGYGIWIAYNEQQNFLSALNKIGYGGSAIVILLSLLNYAMRYLRWQGFCQLMGYHIPWGKNLLYYLAGFALTTTPGKAGEAVRTLYMKPYGVKIGSGVAAVAAERISDLVSIILLAVVAIYHFPSYLWLAIITAAAILCGIIFIHNRSLHQKANQLTNKFTQGRLQKTLQHGFNMLDEISLLLGRQAFLRGLILGTLGWAAEAYGLFYIITAMGYHAPMLIVFGIYALSMLAGAASFMPGGLGGTEAVMSLMLIAIGTTHSDAATATILCRLATLWLAVIIGLAALTYAESMRQNPAKSPTA